jgi:hypothetical protein
MSDISQLFEGKISPQDFIAKEWSQFVGLIEKLPAEVQPVAKQIVADLSNALHGVAGEAGSAISAYIAAHASQIVADVQMLLEGAGLSTATGPALADALQAAVALLTALVAHAVATFNNATPAPAAS